MSKGMFGGRVAQSASNSVAVDDHMPSGQRRGVRVASGAVSGSGFLVEREQQLAILSALFVEPVGSGSVVLLSGEAGFGKTSLLRAFVGSLDHRYRILEAACEPVGIPTAFAPLFDVLDGLPEGLHDDVRSGAGRPAVYAGMLDLLKSDRVVLIIEDLHWADEATMGLVRYLGRRIAATKSILIVTFRIEELDFAHPLRLVVADLGLVGTRLELPPLSPAGVEEMTRGLDLDPVRVHAATLGNPFLVEEVIRHPDSKLPSTISNAVLAWADRLSPEALEVLYMVALSPEGVAQDLLTRLIPEAGAYVDLAVQRGLLVSSKGLVACRHDLIRASLEQAVPPALRRDLHRRLFEVLEEGADTSPDVARLAYHSRGAGEDEKAVAYSLWAAHDASKGGAHRQAAFHFSNALELRDEMAGDTVQGVLLDAAWEHCLINAFGVASGLARQRMEMTSTRVDEARARAWLSYFESRENDFEACRNHAELAVDVLEREPSSEELALALSVLAWVSLVEGKFSDSIAYGDRAVSVARVVGSARVEVHAATSAGTSRWVLEDSSGISQIKAALRLGRASGADESTARAMNNLGYINFVSQDLEGARHWFDQLIEFTTARELDAWYIAAVTSLSSVNLAAGRWAETDQQLSMVLGQRTCVQTELEAVMTAAILAARRGDPRSTQMIGAVLARIRGTKDLSVAVLGAVLAMEGAWLGFVDIGGATDAYEEVLRSGALAEDPWGRGLFAFWARRLDLDSPDVGIPGPAGLEWSGRIEEAAAEWKRLGFAIEAAITRALVPDTDLGSVFSALFALGAEGVARGLRRELQRRGVKGIPRGERPSTRQNPAGLTARQAEVLELMTSGLSNAAIAEELFISEKTASHHVSAVLTKLNVNSRLQAVAMASAEGWAGKPVPLS